MENIKISKYLQEINYKQYIVVVEFEIIYGNDITGTLVGIDDDKFDAVFYNIFDITDDKMKILNEYVNNLKIGEEILLRK